MNKKLRTIAALLALTVVFVLLFSNLYIAKNASHDCIGDDCPICYAIRVCENTLKAVAQAYIAAIFTLFLGFAALLLQRAAAKATNHRSLITLKVKLSN